MLSYRKFSARNLFHPAKNTSELIQKINLYQVDLSKFLFSKCVILNALLKDLLSNISASLNC